MQWATPDPLESTSSFSLTPKPERLKVKKITTNYFLLHTKTDLLGKAKTENKNQIWSITCFFYKNKEYVGVAGDCKFFEVFDVEQLNKKIDLLSKFFYISGNFFCSAI